MKDASGSMGALPFPYGLSYMYPNILSASHSALLFASMCASSSSFELKGKGGKSGLGLLSLRLF
jgi:hypothetical protein